MAIALERDYAPPVVEQVQKDARPGLPFSFTGKAGEYFGVWIVNIILSVITLGIYSAWAKVRNKRYFYGNTKLNGSSFSYLASPIQILKGRIIAFIFLAAYAICSTFYPYAGGAILLFLYLITPWVMIKALAFNARNSAYRNLRFNFTGKLWESMKVYLLLTIGTILTLGGLIPYQAFRINDFVANHSYYGRSKFSFGGTISEYYKAYGLALVLFLPLLLLYVPFVIFGAYIAFMTFGMDPEAAAQEGAAVAEHFTATYGSYFDWIPVTWIPLMAAAAIPLAVIGYTYLTTRLQNYFFNNTRIGEHRLYLNLNLWRVLWIRLSNLVVITLTFGLMIPWAKIRMARYQIQQMSLIPHGDLDTAVGEEQAKVRALGEEFGDGMDLDLGLGV